MNFCDLFYMSDLRMTSSNFVVGILFEFKQFCYLIAIDLIIVNKQTVLKELYILNPPLSFNLIF